VDHPSRRRESALRQSLVPSLLAIRQHNEAHGHFDAELFEIANVYLPRPGEAIPNEPARLALVSSRDFRNLKGVVESLLEGLHTVAPLRALPAEVALFAPGGAAELLLGETHVGYLGELDEGQLELFELREKCSAAELEFDVLLQKADLVAQNKPLPPFPAVVRDLSLVVAKSLHWSELCETVKTAAGPTLESLQYSDTFRGGNIEAGYESVHFSMVFRHPERTLTGQEVDRAVKSVVDACHARFHAALRA
jgi:phenylalanyl-tRNA synthetase beta chain